MVSIPLSNFTDKPLFKLRWILFNALLKNFYGLPVEFNPLLPGLEVKFALEEAKKLDSKLVFLGSEFDDLTVSRLKHETRSSLVRFLYNYFHMPNHYKIEGADFKSILQNSGFNDYVESYMDRYQVNWYTQTLAQMFPEYKRILIDRKEEELFRQIISNKSKRMVAVVNQFHMEGLEHLWCNAHGLKPSSAPSERINPIGDMDLRNMLYHHMFHVIMREVKASRMRSPPASFTDEINIYHREFNHQYEHRNM